MNSCEWCLITPKMTDYHDNEWGIPVHDDRKQFEYLMMEVMQCGLSWKLMLEKREIFRNCFDGFDYGKIAQYDEDDIERILNTEGMIRSRRKIEAIIHNALCFIELRKQYGSFSKWLWKHSNHKTILYPGHNDGCIPAADRLSDQISKELREMGFKYLGSITVYAHLQACGMVNDHHGDCPCYHRIIENYPVSYEEEYDAR